MARQFWGYSWVYAVCSIFKTAYTHWSKGVFLPLFLWEERIPIFVFSNTPLLAGLRSVVVNRACFHQFFPNGFWQKYCLESRTCIVNDKICSFYGHIIRRQHIVSTTDDEILQNLAAEILESQSVWPRFSSRTLETLLIYDNERQIIWVFIK